MPRNTKKQRLLDLMEANQWSLIGEQEWLTIAAAVPGVRSDDLRAAGLRAEAPWCGVSQHTFAELAASLNAMTAVYQARPEWQRFCRREVIRAKDRARIISHSASVNAAKCGMKAEMVEWMLIWLADPLLFPTWVEVRNAKPSGPVSNNTDP